MPQRDVNRKPSHYSKLRYVNPRSQIAHEDLDVCEHQKQEHMSRPDHVGNNN